MNNFARVDVVGTGFAVLDCVYHGETRIFETLGGSCANVLWSLAILERTVVPILNLGTDHVGQFLVSEFERVGADTRYITRRENLSSPVLVQHIEADSGKHHFSFICPETQVEFPRYKPIEEADIIAAKEPISNCKVFYVDRLSEAIVSAMEVAAAANSIVYFEPSAIENAKLFERAIECSSIFKISQDRLGRDLSPELDKRGLVSIITHASKGLEVRVGNAHVWCEAFPTSYVRDTSGSGDMVTVGLIDCLVGTNQEPISLEKDTVLAGIRAGQKLASFNCSFLGARGFFRNHRSVAARIVLCRNYLL